MAVNKPVGDNARKGAVRKRPQFETKGRETLEQAQQGIRSVHGSEGEGEVQGRSAGEVMGKAFLAIIALSIAVLIGLSAWIILL